MTSTNFALVIDSTNLENQFEQSALIIDKHRAVLGDIANKLHFIFYGGLFKKTAEASVLFRRTWHPLENRERSENFGGTLRLIDLNSNYVLIAKSQSLNLDMCRRFTFHFSPDALKIFELLFGIKIPEPEYPPARFNIPPGVNIHGVLSDDDGSNKFIEMLWGLIPSFSEEFKQHPKLKVDLTRVETFFEKPDSFRAGLLKTSRCVIPANSYFEWEHVGKQRLPYLIKLKESELMGLGGIYDIWQDFRETKYFSCSIITMPASKLLARIHPRMPFMLEKDQLNLWLDSSIQDFQYLRDQIKPYPDDGLLYYPVSTRVNKVENDDAELLEPIKAHQNVQRDLFK